MLRPLHPLRIYLKPGEHSFAGRDSRISTVLGSCVSMTFWHPKLLVGGMCHFMLPERGGESMTGDRAKLDGRYGDEAMALLMKKINGLGAAHKEYQVKLFGGGNMFPDMPKNTMSQVGSRNVRAARQLVEQHGFSSVAEHLGGIGYRNVIFEVWSGEVWVRHSSVPPIAFDEPVNRRLG